jgi:serine/threonine-protein phosphatase 2A regulatory subunit B
MLTQSFGDIEEELVNKADTVTALEFHPNGRYLATGDMGGRIVLLSRNSEESSSGSGSRVDRDTDDASEGQYWNPYFQFQSHEPEFDYLKSIDIAEKINKIKFIETGTESRLKILSANEKSIKLWNISDKPKYQAANSSRIESKGIDLADNLTFPRKITRSKSNVGISNTTYASLKKNFDNAHNYHIHSLSLCNDGESFLSGDDLTINIWNFERSESCYNIVDIKPDNMDDLTMVITAAKYHPLHCNLVAASTSCGTVHLVDLRKFSTIDTSEINKCPDSSDNFGIFSPSALSPPRNLLLRRDDSGIENLNALDESQKYVKHTTPMSLDEAKGYFASRFMKSSSDFDYPSGSSTSFTSDVYSHSDVSNVDLPRGMSEVTSSISDFCFSQVSLIYIYLF